MDYKENFAFLLCGKEDKPKKIAEFCNDICAFANADGGYLFFGIAESGGTPLSIKEIHIENKDKFELNLRNNIQRILPIVPLVNFYFIMVNEGNYVVVVVIEKGTNKPYTYNDKNSDFYKFFVRRGNGKRPMTYSEIRDDYLHSKSLTEEIAGFRRTRAEFYSNEYSNLPFALLQVIPADFYDSVINEHLYDEWKEKQPPYTTYFNDLTYDSAVPNVDGVCFPDSHPDENRRLKNLLQLFNNGVSEYFMPLDFETNERNETVLAVDYILKKMEAIVLGTYELYSFRGKTSMAYLCASIIGCKDFWNKSDRTAMYRRKIDRNIINVMPVEVRNITDENQVKEAIDQCKMMIKYSVGIGR